MTLRKALLAATLLAVPSLAGAQPVSGLYVGAGIGTNYREDLDGNGYKFLTRVLGQVAVGSVGWGFGNGLRAELEGNFRSSELGNSDRNRRNIGSSGYALTYGAMVNALYDFNLGLPVTPYVGVGVGYGWSEIRHVRTTRSLPGYTINDTDGQFAYQAIGGLSYDLGAAAPGLSLTAEYRYYGTLDPSFETRAPAGAAPLGSIKLSNANHAGLLGVRYAFNTPRPAPVVAAPPAPPPPAVARTYLVFFDWDKADLTDRARQIITEAAGASRRVTTTKIEVAGHADRSGTPQYNQRLSERRAQAVAAELVRQGVARNDIAITAFGESKPLVPTADGVREPQNRRVEIVLR